MKIFTDGAYSSLRNKGGYSFVVLENEKFSKFYCKAKENTTNQQTEILAVIAAFKYIIKYNLNAEIVTDSMYVVGTATKDWKINANIELWDEFFEYYRIIKHRVSFTHTRGHQTDDSENTKGNNLADMFAVFASDYG
jgi:ribonuclease HI